MIWLVFKTLLSLPYKISMYGIYTLPVGLIRSTLRVIGIELDTFLLAEFMIILYQYTAVAFSFGVTIGVVNLCIFYVIGELFNWFENLLRVDISGFLPTKKESTGSSSPNVEETTSPLPSSITSSPAQLPVPEEPIISVNKRHQLSLHMDTNNSRQRVGSARVVVVGKSDTCTEADTESGDTTVITTFTDLNPESVSEITDATEFSDRTK